MRKGTKAFLWIVILAAVVAAFGATAVNRLKKEEVKTIESVQEAEGIPVDYVVTQVVTVGDWRNFVGVAEGHDQIDLFADYRTRVSAVHASVGDHVKTGRVIVSLDEYDPARFVVNLGTSRAQYYTARTDSSRMEELFKSGAISQQELDHVRTETDRARAAYKTARRAVQLDSPISGVLTALYVQSGEYAEAGEILATVSSYRRIKIALDVSETDIAVIRKGQEVRLPLTNGAHDATKGGNYLQGTVANVSLSADPESRLFRVDLVVDNPDGIMKPGSLVSPQIKVAASGGGPAVPERSLLTVNGLDMVYVIKESDQSHHAELREIITGIGDGSLLAVTNGLRQGEWVVVWGQGKLNDGQKVKLHENVTSEFFDTVKSREGLR
jgi:membrane fusion protein (multidrug efflux system)